MRATGRLNDLSKLPLPPASLGDRECDEAVGVFRRLVADACVALDAVAQAQRELEAARTALAEAKRAGKADPGGKGVERAERALEGARGEAEAATLAAERSRDDLAALLASRRGPLVEAARVRAGEAGRTSREAVLALQEAHADLADAARLEAFCASFPEPSELVVPSRLPDLAGPKRRGLLDRGGAHRAERRVRRPRPRAGGGITGCAGVLRGSVRVPCSSNSGFSPWGRGRARGRRHTPANVWQTPRWIVQADPRAARLAATSRYVGDRARAEYDGRDHESGAGAAATARRLGPQGGMSSS